MGRSAAAPKKIVFLLSRFGTHSRPVATLFELARFEAGILGGNAGTVLERGKALRASGQVSKRIKGAGRGARMTSRDAVNLFLACALDHRYGTNPAEAVRQVRELEFDPESIRLIPLGGLTCWGARTAGEALENLIDDYRTGRVAIWAKGEKVEVKVMIDLRGLAVFIYLTKPDRDAIEGKHAVADYTVSGYLQNPLPLKRQMEVDGTIFEKFAKILGAF
jgi:hypothetical protein